MKAKTTKGISTGSDRIKVGNESCTLWLVVILFSICSTFMLREIFYFISPWIWEQNIQDHPRLMPVMEEWKHVESGFGGRDGIELYVLYTLMFVNIGMVFVLTKVFSAFFSCTANARLIIIFLVSLFFMYLWRVGIHFPMTGDAAIRYGGIPPLPIPTRISQTLIILLLVGSTVYLKLKLSSLQWKFLILVFLIPICFIATGQVSDNSGFIFLPALQIGHGVPLNEIYFQYDAFLSLLALVWIKLGFSMASIQGVGQLSFLLAVVFVYGISSKLFASKTLPLLLLCSLILIRFYAGPGETASELQGSPLRLDLWLILFCLVYLLGPFHWSLGLSCGLLVIFHRNFGLIYSAAYVQLILALLLTDLLDRRKGSFLLPFLVGHLKRIAPTILLLTASFMVRNYYFGTNTAADYYRSIGFGFTKIQEDSIYWYFPIVIASTAVLLFLIRRSVSQRNYALGLFLITCSVGNSLYYFGRSHEWNLLTLSFSLLFMLFFFFDILSRKITDLIGSRDTANAVNKNKYWLTALPIIFFSTIAWAYAPTINDKLIKQLSNIRMGRIHVPSQFPNEILFSQRTIEDVNRLIGGNHKIEFFELDGSLEFYLFYYSGTPSKAFFRPSETWLFQEDFRQFIFQHLVDRGYLLMSRAFLRVFPQLELQLSQGALGDNAVSYCRSSWAPTTFRGRLLGETSSLPEQSFKLYIDSHADLKAAYNLSNSDLGIAEWGKLHYDRHGREENRHLILPSCWVTVGTRYILIGPPTERER